MPATEAPTSTSEADTSATSWNGVPNVSGIPWYSKFSGIFPPYGNDPHPYLIWNLYRVNQAGQIDQIGRSGVKHAFLTINSGCEEACGNSHILGKGCGDTYSSGNNDSNSDLGPRREIVPARGLWGRCGSIYDSNCDGVPNSSPNTSWDQRLISRESQLDPAQNPGAQYYFESWYVVRDDSAIYNSMGYRQITPSFGGGVWAGSNPQPFSLGPVLSAWVNPNSPGASARNTELVAPEGLLGALPLPHFRIWERAVIDAASDDGRAQLPRGMEIQRGVSQIVKPNSQSEGIQHKLQDSQECARPTKK